MFFESEIGEKGSGREIRRRGGGVREVRKEQAAGGNPEGKESRINRKTQHCVIF